MKKLHITISGTPSSGLEGLLSNENPLLKAGLLYADNVKLSSMSSALLIDLAKIYTFNEVEKIQFMQEVLPFTIPNEQQRLQITRFLEYYRQLLSKRRLTPIEKNDLLQFRRQRLNHIWIPMREKALEIVVQSGMDKLFPYVNNDILELESLTPRNNTEDAFIEEWLSKLDSMLNNPNTYPLLDKTINSLVAHAQETISSLGSHRKNHISERAAHAGFVSNVYQTLPSFEQAGLDEIMDIRKELEKPLINFRSAMMEFSLDINSVPWEEEFEYEVQKLYISKVLPAIKEVEELCEENKMLKKVMTRIVDDNIVRWSSGLGFGIASLTELSSLVYLNAVPVGLATIEGLREWQAVKSDAGQKKMYYYNAIDKKLR